MVLKRRLVQHRSYYAYGKERSNVELAIYIGILIIAIILAVILVVSADKIDLIGLQKIEHTVRRGETLWSITNIYRPNSVQPQIYIDELKRINDLETVVLVPGQIITIIDGMDYR